MPQVGREQLALLALLALAAVVARAETTLPPVVVDNAKSIEDATSKLPEPQFPSLLYDPVEQTPISPRRAKIVTELIGGEFKRTAEEYLNLDLGRSAYVLQDAQLASGGQLQPHQRVIMANARTDQLFKYRPYTCETTRMSDDSNDLTQGLDYWSYTTDVGRATRRTQAVALRIFGVAGMWLFAMNSAERTYARANQVYSASKDIYRLAHMWTVVDAKRDLNIKFYFISTTYNANSLNDEKTRGQISNELTLEMVQLESRTTNQVVRTINVLSIDYEFELEVYENLMEPPVGYGCQTDEVIDADADSTDAEFDRANTENEIKAENAFWTTYLWKSSLVELEVTATKIEAATNKRLTDTIYVELAHLPMKTAQKDYDLMLTKIKSSDSEIKTISDHFYNVKYQIDLRKGSCRISHLKSASGGGGGGSGEQKEDANDLLLKFNNGLRLSLERDQMEALFATKEAFHLIKSTKKWTSKFQMLTHVYLERTLGKWPLLASAPGGDAGQIAREIRTLVTETQLDAQGQQAFSARLESITIWVLDAATQSRILEIYHLNVIEEERPLAAWPDVSRLFDVSQECYLDNEKMRSGTDYAWVEFFYPLASRQLDLLMQNDFELKRVIYEKLVGQYQLASARVPRLELMFSDEGLVVRALLLDLPSLEILYAAYDGQMIALEKTAGDFMFVAADLTHCAKLCQLYSCKSFTFCSGTRACLLGMSVVADPTGATAAAAPQPPSTKTPPRQTVKPNRGCITFSVPVEDEARLDGRTYARRLSSLLSFISHQDYDIQDVPRAPDELMLPRDETGVSSDTEYKRFIAAYLLEITEYLTQKGNKAPTLVISLMMNDHFIVLLPSKFTIENNPLDDFAIPGRIDADGNQVDESVLYDSTKVVSFFHEGLSMTRYKFNEFRGSLRERSRLLTGLTYDQCALGCLDSKCGTFSYCPGRKECVITPLDNLGQASRWRLTEEDGECFIAQRDFAKNFQKYPNVKRPSEAAVATLAESASDCALQCLRRDGQVCMSFDYCERLKDSSREAEHPSDKHSTCYLQSERHPEELFAEAPAAGQGGAISGADVSHSSLDEPPSGAASARCDHYERSYLAEFTQIEARQVTDELVDQLKTTEYTGGSLTPMDCAEICLNQLNDCSAFQFCFDPAAKAQRSSNGRSFWSVKYALSCLMIQSKPSDAAQQKGLEVLVDSKASELVGASKYLEYNNHCQVFALRPDTLQAHLRDLAMGNTMTVEEKAQREAAAASASSGVHMSWPGYLLMFLSVTLVSAALGVGVCYARERNEFVRDQIERARYFVGL